MNTFFSPGSAPPVSLAEAAVAMAHKQFATVDDGDVSTVYPALARARRDSFGIVIARLDGEMIEAGDTTDQFTLMSVAKPFVFALVCEAMGVDEARDAIGVNATGRAFNDLGAVGAAPGGRTNPMVNPGAIATTSRMPGASSAERWEHLLTGMSRFAGRDLALDDEVLESSLATNHRNRELAQQVEAAGALALPAAEAVDLYTRQSSIAVAARDLAVMGVTLASGGVNPCTHERVVSPRVCRHVLAAMATAGMYERSGDWLWDVGLPGKSGISGGILTVAPGKGALATWSPPLDVAGNSVRGALVAEQLAFELGFDMFAVPAGAGG